MSASPVQTTSVRLMFGAVQVTGVSAVLESVLADDGWEVSLVLTGTNGEVVRAKFEPNMPSAPPPTGLTILLRPTFLHVAIAELQYASHIAAARVLTT